MAEYDTSAITAGLGTTLASIGAFIPYLLALAFIGGIIYVLMKRKQMSRYLPFIRDYKYRAVIFPLRGGEYLPEYIDRVCIYEENGNDVMHLEKYNVDIKPVGHKFLSRSGTFCLFTKDFKEYIPIEARASVITETLDLLPVISDGDKQYYENKTKRIRDRYRQPSLLEKYGVVIAALIVVIGAVGIIAVNNNTFSEASTTIAAANVQISENLNDMAHTLATAGYVVVPNEPAPSNPDDAQPEPPA